MDDFAPIKTFKSRSRPNPIITPEIKSLMGTRDYWRALARNTDDSLAGSAYKNFKNEAKREIKIGRMEFVHEQITNNLNNSNCLWKTIRMCVPSKLCNQHKSYSKDDKVVANEFNMNSFQIFAKMLINKFSPLFLKQMTLIQLSLCH